MLKKILLLLLLVSLTFAKTAYENAMEAFKSKKYEQAFQIFDTNKSLYFSNTLYNYHYGMSSYMTGKYKIAMSAFERILFDNPKHHYAKLQLGRTFLKLYMYEDAKNEFEELLNDHTFPSQAKPQVAKYLKQAEKFIKNNTIDVSLVAGIHYDSNINQVPESDKIFIPLLKVEVSPSQVKEDYYHQEFINLKHTASIFGRGSWSLSNSLLLLSKGYFSEKTENSLYASYRPELSYRTDGYVGKFAIQAIKSFKDGDMYSTTYSIAPSIDFLVFDSVKTTLEMSYSLKRHDKEKKQESDSSTLEGSVALSDIMISNINTGWKLTYGQEVKRYDERIDVSNRYGSTQLSLFMPLSSQFFARWTNSYQRKHYLDFNRFFQNKRKDNIFASIFSLLYQPFPSVLGELTFTYQQNKSNQALYEYKKGSVGLSFYKTLSY